MKPKLVAIIFMFFLAQQATARELLGYNVIDFGMPFVEANSLVSHKKNFEVWTRTKDPLEKHLKFDVELQGHTMVARAFFKNGRAEGFNVTTGRYTVSDETACGKEHQKIHNAIVQKYGKPSIVPITYKKVGLVVQESYFGFNDRRHIEVNTMFDEMFGNKCSTIVSYINDSIPQEAINRSRGAIPTKPDGF